MALLLKAIHYDDNKFRDTFTIKFMEKILKWNDVSTQLIEWEYIQFSDSRKNYFILFRISSFVAFHSIWKLLVKPNDI